MATSGTATFTYNRDQIIKAALRKLGAIQSGETPDAQTIQDASDALNILVKAWNATGIHIWTETEATLFLAPGVASYTLGGTNVSNNATETFTQTTLAVGAANGATSVTVSSGTGFAFNVYVGITLDSGSIFWTTATGATVGTNVVLFNALTGAASAGNLVFNYVTPIIRPLRVVDGRRYVFSSALETPLIPLSRLDYRDLPNKTNTGTVTQFFYDPRGGANTQGIIYVWPAPSDATAALKFTWYRPMQDFVAAANNPDLPTEWIDALIWNLAEKLAPEYDCPPSRFQMIMTEAGKALDLAMGWDREPESIYFGVNFDQR